MSIPIPSRITGLYEHRPGEWRCRRIIMNGRREWAPTAAAAPAAAMH